VVRIASVVCLLCSLWKSGVHRNEFENFSHFTASYCITWVFLALNVAWFKKMVSKAAALLSASGKKKKNVFSSSSNPYVGSSKTEDRDVKLDDGYKHLAITRKEKRV